MEEEKQQGVNGNRKRAALALFAVTGIIAAVAAFFYLQYKNTHISTDDAFIEGRVHVISSKVSGTVKQVHVPDNQFVKKGDLILEIDAADYDVKMKEAESGLSAEKSKRIEAETKIMTAQKQLAELGHRLDAAKAGLEVQEANLRQAEADLKRAGNLYEKEAISKERYEKAKTGYDVAAAQVKAAKDQVKLSETSMETQRAVIMQAESAGVSQGSAVSRSEAVLKSAELNSGYTKIYAPADGHITKKSVQVGNLIQAGQPLMAVVPLDDIWVAANYKETQLGSVRPGQSVSIKVDTYPGRVFKGRVESIMAGTGSAFSLFPPENATGNFVKVVQRIPVKIVLDRNSDTDHILRVGMSAESTILIGK